MVIIEQDVPRLLGTDVPDVERGPTTAGDRSGEPTPAARTAGTTAVSADPEKSSSARPAPARSPARRNWDPLREGFVPGMAAMILATILLTFVADLLVVGHVKHARDQQTAYAQLREALANGTAPVNQTGDDGALLALGTPLGVIEIPQLGIREVFFEGTTSQVTQSGPGHRRDTPMPGQGGTSVIFGRKAGFGGPFTLLSELTPGSVFWVWTGQGKSIYRVTGQRVAGDPAPSPLAQGQGRLTLVAARGADYGPSGTLRVDAQLLLTHAEDAARRSNTVLPAGPRTLTTLDLPIAERAARADQEAYVPLLAWLVVLVLIGSLAAWSRTRFGQWRTWLAAGPALLAAALALSEQAARLLPNVL